MQDPIASSAVSASRHSRRRLLPYLGEAGRPARLRETVLQRRTLCGAALKHDLFAEANLRRMVEFSKLFDVISCATWGFSAECAFAARPLFDAPAA